jgi:hypothetical protein
LGNIYSVIAYYLRQPQTVEQYLREQDQAAAQTRQTIESCQDANGLRERLRERRAKAVKWAGARTMLAVEDLALLAECGEPGDLANLVLYLPLR